MDLLGRQRRRLKQDALTLVDEATAFLIGRFGAHTAFTGPGTPPWTRVYSLSHPRPSVLTRGLELQRRTAPAPVGPWARAKYDILEELVELSGGRPDRIEQLKRECLIPLELDLMDPRLCGILPGEVLAMAMSRLGAHPWALQHRAPSPHEF